MFVSIQVEEGHAVLPIDSIILIQDIGDKKCRVIYRDSEGRQCVFEATDRADHIGDRINSTLMRGAEVGV